MLAWRGKEGTLSTLAAGPSSAACVTAAAPLVTSPQTRSHIHSLHYTQFIEKKVGRNYKYYIKGIMSNFPSSSANVGCQLDAKRIKTIKAYIR